jgi:hypothetical protein
VTVDATATAGAAPQQAKDAFQHPRVAQLLQKAQAAGGIGQVITQVLRNLIHPQDTIVFCYFSFDMGAGGTGAEANNFYTCDVVLVTSAYYINVTLFPKAHSYRKRKIHTIADVLVKYDPPTPDELRNVKAGGFSPSNIALSIVFADDRGTTVESWSIESTHPEQVRMLHEIAAMANKCVGFPLSRIGGG